MYWSRSKRRALCLRVGAERWHIAAVAEHVCAGMHAVSPVTARMAHSGSVATRLPHSLSDALGSLAELSVASSPPAIQTPGIVKLPMPPCRARGPPWGSYS